MIYFCGYNRKVSTAILFALIFCTSLCAYAQQGSLQAPHLGGNYMSPKIQWYEAHWQGMDTQRLTKELSQKLQYPVGLKGVFIIEVTLNAALSGLLAADIIVAIESHKVTDLKSFQEATKKVQHKTSAAVSVLRKTQKIQSITMKPMVFVLRGQSALGFAQAESAPMIQPGDIRPHPHRGPCTLCHAIGTGFQLEQDPDLIVLPPPKITEEEASIASPHEERGHCRICHSINKQVIR